MKNNSSLSGKLLLLIGLPIAGFIASCASNADKEDKSNFGYNNKKAAATEISGDMAPPPPPGSEEAQQAMADSVASATNVYAPMITGKLNDTNHVFMRNADMRCSVKDVRKATFDLEHIVRKHDGFVTYTNLSGNKTLYTSTRVNKDSMMNMYKLNVYNDIVLRVPNKNLDSMLIEMNGLIEFIDNRTIKADDVKLQLLALSLKSKRNTQHIKNLNNAVANQGKKLPNTVDALNEIDNTKASYDEQQLNMLDLKDKVSYSTVKLYVYQPEVTEFKKAVYYATPEPYSPSFSDKLATTGATSLVILEYLLLFFVVIWPFLFIFILVWLIIKWTIRTKIVSRLFKI